MRIYRRGGGFFLDLLFKLFQFVIFIATVVYRDLPNSSILRWVIPCNGHYILCQILTNTLI